MTRVLFVIPYMNEGGAQRALSNIQLHLPEGWQINTIINSETDTMFPIRGSIVRLIEKNNFKASSLAAQINVFLKRIRCISGQRKRNRYNACISFVDSANFSNIISSGLERRTGTKTIISVRTSISEAALKMPQYRYIVKPISRLLYRKADLVVSVSEELKKELIEYYGIRPEKIVTINNGFDIGEIRKLSEEDIPESVEHMIGRKRIVLTAGRLNSAKNQWHLIRAFKSVKDVVPESLLIIAGSGELESYLKEITKKLHLEKDVVFLGFEANVYRFMHRADVFVLPSAFEGFPNALVEALCSGAPCVASDFRTGAREILAPELLFVDRSINEVTECEYGLLSPACSGKRYRGNEPLEMAEIELAKAISCMLTDSNLNGKYRQKSIERSKFYDINHEINKWIDVIEG